MITLPRIDSRHRFRHHHHSPRETVLAVCRLRHRAGIDRFVQAFPPESVLDSGRTTRPGLPTSGFAVVA
jgi:hypothetical protein